MINFDEIKDAYNNQPLDDFCGLSPNQINSILYSPEESEFLKIIDSKEANNEIPFLRLLNELINNIDFNKGLKLTATGNLPVKTVKEIYSKKIILDYPIEHGVTKLSKETDYLALNCVKIIGKMSGYLRISKNRIYVTKKSQNFNENSQNFKHLLFTFGIKFNKGYYDGYDDNMISQQDFLFSLYLIFKYGSEKRSADFYAERYFQAFPMIGERLRNRKHCYIIRTFDRFFNLFGLVEKSGKFDNEKIVKTKLFDKYIKIN